MSEANKRILETQKSYFSLLKDCFKEQLSCSKEAGGDIEQAVKNWAINKPVKEIINFTKQRLQEIHSFWETNYKPLKDTIIGVDMLPTYSVSRPSYFKKQLSSAGLYCDFFVYHDDSMSGLRNFEALSDGPLTNISMNLMKDYIEIILLESVFICDIEIPLAIIMPSEHDINTQIEKKLIARGLSLTINYANELLGTKYGDWEELRKNTENILGSTAIKKTIKKPHLLPAPFSDTSDPYERLGQCFKRLRMIQSQSVSSIPRKASLYNLITNFLTEFSVLESQLHGSLEIDSALLLPRYTWDLYKWRIDSGNIESSKLLGWEERRITGIATSLQSDNLSWLCNVPISSLVELRKSGFLEEFRSKLRSSRRKMTIEQAVDFNKLSKEIQLDIENAIKEHQDSIQELEREAKKRIKVDTITFLGKMWFEIASRIIPLFSLIGVVSDGAEYVTKLKGNIKTLKDIPEKYKRGPWGVLMQVKQDRG